MARPARRPARGNPNPVPSWVPGLLTTVATVAAIPAWWFGLPGFAFILVALLVGAWTVTPPQLTGPKKDGYPTAGHPGEVKAQRRYRFWSELKWKLSFPVMAFLPGWPPLAAWFGSLLVAGFVWALPHLRVPGAPPHALRYVDAVCAIVVIGCLAEVRRRTVNSRGMSPGVRVPMPRAWAGLVDKLRDLPAKALDLRFEHMVAAVRTLIVAAAPKNYVGYAKGALGRVMALPARAWTGVKAKLRGTGKVRLAGAVVTAGVGYLIARVVSTMDLPRVPAPIIGGTWDHAWVMLTWGAVFAAVVARPWVDHSLATWRDLMAGAEQWEPRWEMLKLPGAQLIRRTRVGPALVERFSAPGAPGAAGYYLLAPKIAPTLDGATQVAVLSVAGRDTTGQERPGTRHPNEFEVVSWPVDAIPSIADPSLDADTARLLVQCAMVWTADSMGYARPILDELIPLSATGEDGLPASPAQAYNSTWLTPDGPPASSIRFDLCPSMSGTLNAEVIGDHRANNGQGCVYVGALTDDLVIDPATGFDLKQVEDLRTENYWRRVWSGALKQGVNAPKAEHGLYEEAKLPRGQTVYRQPFIMLQGDDLGMYFAAETKLKTALEKSFVAVTGFCPPRSNGQRHPLGLVVTYSESPPVSPADLAPSGATAPSRPMRDGQRVPASRTAEPTDSRAQEWMLAGLVHLAFTAARLSRPEMISATCLTHPRSRGHIWRLTVRLYDGVTVADVRGAAQRLRTAFAVPWLRVEQHEHGVSLVLGAEPARVQLINSEEKFNVKSLDWGQAFMDAKLVGVGGITPTLTAMATLPKNEAVEVLDFTVPSGLALADLKGAYKKLGTSTSNAFVEVRPHPSGNPSMCQVLASEENPLPDYVPFEYGTVDESEAIPFATGIEGEPIEFDPLESPHVLLAGVSGAGKSVMAQNFLYGFAVRGAEIYVIDPVKGGADFKFLDPYAKAITGDVFEAAGVMKLIYAEVVRRKDLNAQYGVDSYRKVPGEKLLPIAVMIDEFTSLMQRSAVPPDSDDQEAMQEKALIVAENNARVQIGMLAGKLAREARSAGVTLLLGTQKMSAKMLDSIPGGGDLKSLGLDELIPVPACHRFPVGWARVADLEIGDLLFAPDGSTTPIIGFTEVGAQEDCFEVIFDDGHRIVSGAGHGWMVSDDAELRRLGIEVEVGRDVGLARVVTTREMAVSVLDVEGRPRYSVPVTDPVNGPTLHEDRDHNAFRAGSRLSRFTATNPATTRWLRASLKQRLEFAQGVMSMYGEVTADGDCLVLVPCASTGAVMRELFESLGIRVPGADLWSKVPVPAHTAGTDHGETRATKSRPHLWSFATDLPMFDPSHPLARKQRRDTTIKDRWRDVVEVVPIPSQPTRCIAVAHPSHLFLAAGHIPTHNTNLARTLLGKASQGDRMSALRIPDSAPPVDGDIGKGRGLWESLTAPAQVVQVWYAPAEELGRELSTRVAPLPAEQRVDLTQFSAPELEVDGAIIDDDGTHPMGAPPSNQPASAPVGDEAPVIELDALDLSDWNLFDDDPATPSDEVAATAAGDGTDTTEDADVVVVTTSIVWDDIDPEPWMPAESAYGWDEIDALEGFLREHPGITEVTWMDDKLLEVDDLTGVQFLDIASDVAASAGAQLRGPESPNGFGSQPTPPTQPSSDDTPSFTPATPVAAMPVHNPVDDDMFAPIPVGSVAHFIQGSDEF